MSFPVTLVLVGLRSKIGEQTHMHEAPDDFRLHAGLFTIKEIGGKGEIIESDCWLHACVWVLDSGLMLTTCVKAK